jgi:hypothetical protein
MPTTSPLPDDVTPGDADGPTGGLSHTERVLYGRAGQLKRWSETPLAERPAQTQAARDARLLKLEQRIDPEGKLDPGERRQLALQARRAHMQQIAAKSAQARRMRATSGSSALAEDAG